MNVDPSPLRRFAGAVAFAAAIAAVWYAVDARNQRVRPEKAAAAGKIASAKAGMVRPLETSGEAAASGR